MALRHLSDRDLISSLKKLIRTERETTLSILEHLGEVDSRRLYLPLGYGTLFDYCTQHLGYSSSGAGRRIAAARCIRRFPQIAELLRCGEANLSTVSAVAGIITDENKNEVIGQMRGKPYNDVEMIVASYKPQTLLRDRVKPVCLRVPASKPTGHTGQHHTSMFSHSQIGSRNTKKTSDKSESPVEKTEQRFMIQFAASPEFMKKVSEAKALLSNRHLRGVSFENVFEAALDLLLDKHSPAKRNERRRTRRAVKKPQPKRNIRARGSRRPDHPVRTRRVSIKTRDAVHERDNGRCTYVGANGRRCKTTHHLHIDHIVPFARGGANALSNLRLLCGAHNRLEAERVYGETAARFNRRE